MRMLQKRMQKQMLRGMGIDPSMFEDAQKSRASHAGEKRRNAGSNQRRARAASRKIIPEGYGEYIKFTVHSITGTEAWLDTSASPVYVKYTESQITDIRWTEHD